MQDKAASGGPKISVVVAVYNAAGSLRKTITSILAQTYQNVEIVLIDGASTDGTLERVADLRHRIHYVLSERDKGIADAYNKGIAAATGDWVYFLNADDVFDGDDVLATVFSSGDLFEGFDLLAGTVRSDQGRVFDGHFGWRLLVRNQVHHQAIFYKAAVLKAMPYNASYRRYGHDHEHNLLIWRRNLRVKYLQQSICLWATGGVSDSAKWKDYKEEFAVRRNSVGALGYPFNIFTLGRFVVKRYLLGRGA